MTDHGSVLFQDGLLSSPCTRTDRPSRSVLVLLTVLVMVSPYVVVL